MSEQPQGVVTNPDCAAGKHGSCSGDGYDPITDTVVACPCDCHTHPHLCQTCGLPWNVTCAAEGHQQP